MFWGSYSKVVTSPAVTFCEMYSTFRYLSRQASALLFSVCVIQVEIGASTSYHASSSAMQLAQVYATTFILLKAFLCMGTASYATFKN